jgi:hypothetical protein
LDFYNRIDMATENFVTDKKGRKIAVQISIKTYEKLLADSEELDDIKEYRKAKMHKGDAIPFDQAFREIEDALK